MIDGHRGHRREAHRRRERRRGVARRPAGRCAPAMSSPPTGRGLRSARLWAGPGRLPRRLAGGAPVLPRRGPGRPTALGVVRAGHGAGLRLVVPVAGWHRQRGLWRGAPARGNPRAGSGASASTCWPGPHIARVLGPDAAPIGPWKAWPIPAGITETALTGLGGRVLFVGDAARACDPMTGEGIAQALETAELAARAINGAGPVAAGGGGGPLSAADPVGHGARRPSRPGSLPGPGAPARRSRARCASRTAASGSAGSSPAGCSRTTRGRSWSRRTDGAAGCSAAPGPSGPDRPTGYRTRDL